MRGLSPERLALLRRLKEAAESGQQWVTLSQRERRMARRLFERGEAQSRSQVSITARGIETAISFEKKPEAGLEDVQ